MTESNARRVFGAVEITAPDTNKDWRAVPRSEMFGAVIVAVDGAKSEAEDLGDTHFVQYVDSVLFPFLEAEFEAARYRGAKLPGRVGGAGGLSRLRGRRRGGPSSRRAVKLDPSYTVKELLEKPPGDFGIALDAVLHMSEEEKIRVAFVFARTFMSPLRPERIGS